MIGTIRKHQNWLWTIIIAVIIVTFVLFFSPSNRFFGGGLRSAAQDFTLYGKPVTIDGRPISTTDYNSAYGETLLAYFFRGNGAWPANDSSAQENLRRDTIFRVFLVSKLKDMGIEVSDKAVATMGHERLGTYPLASFEKEHLQPHRLMLADFERFLAHEAAIQQLMRTAAVSARLLHPSEATLLYRKEYEEVSTEVVAFWATNFLDNVLVTPAVIGQFFTNRMATYRVPERVQVSYVEFATTNFFADADKQMSSISNLNQSIEEYYLKRDPKSFTNASGAVLTEAEAKSRIKETLREENARMEARRKASELGTELYNQQANQADALDKLAAAKGLAVKVTPPFDRLRGLDDFDFPPEFKQKALALTEQQPLSVSPIVGENAIYLIALKNRIPSELPAFDKIQAKVTADYRNTQALELARKAGAAFYTTLTNGLAQKKYFSEICAQAKVKSLAIPPFSPSMTSLPGLPEKLNLRQLQSLTSTLKPGEVSAFVPNADGGFILYMRSVLPLDETKMKAELPEFLGRLRLYRQNEAFNQWFRKAAEQAHLSIPTKEGGTGAPGLEN